MIPLIPSIRNDRLQTGQLLIRHPQRPQQMLLQQRRARKRQQQRRRKRLPTMWLPLRERRLVPMPQRHRMLLQFMRQDRRVLSPRRRAARGVVLEEEMGGGDGRVFGGVDLVAHVHAELAEFALFDHCAVFALAFAGGGADTLAPGFFFGGELVVLRGVAFGARRVPVEGGRLLVLLVLDLLLLLVMLLLLHLLIVLLLLLDELLMLLLLLLGR